MPQPGVFAPTLRRNWHQPRMDEKMSSMDEDEFEAIRRWGESLQQSDEEQFGAAGKAIVLLTAEIDRLERELWNVKTLAVDRTPRRETEDEFALEEEKRGWIRRCGCGCAMRLGLCTRGRPGISFCASRQ